MANLLVAAAALVVRQQALLLAPRQALGPVPLQQRALQVLVLHLGAVLTANQFATTVDPRVTPVTAAACHTATDVSSFGMSQANATVHAASVGH